MSFQFSFLQAVRRSSRSLLTAWRLIGQPNHQGHKEARAKLHEQVKQGLLHELTSFHGSKPTFGTIPEGAELSNWREGEGLTKQLFSVGMGFPTTKASLPPVLLPRQGYAESNNVANALWQFLAV